MEFTKLQQLLPDSETAFNLFSAIDNELYVALDKTSKTILVTSATRQEGRTTIALAFVKTFLRSKPDKSVLLINADQGGASDQMEQQLGIGAGNMPAANDNSYQRMPTAIAGLDYARNFSRDAGMTGLDQEAFDAFIDDAKSRYDLIVVDAAPGTYGNDVISIAKIVTNVIVVIQHRGPKKEQIQALIDSLRRVNANILGTILNKRRFPLPAWLYGKS